MNDHVFTIFQYPNNLTLTYSSIQSNAYDHYYEEFMGTKGTIVLSGETEALLFMEGQKGKATDISATADTRSRDAAGSSVTGKETGGLSAVSAYKIEIEGFSRTIRNGEPNLCDGEEGLKAAAASLRMTKRLRRK